MGQLYRPQIPKTPTKQKTNWDALWSSAKAAFEAAGMPRQKAILDNFGHQKEKICRILNIVSFADVTRIQRRINGSGKKGE
jgi:hypothetical protein